MEQTLVEQVQKSVLLEYLDFKEKELQKSTTISLAVVSAFGLSASGRRV